MFCGQTKTTVPAKSVLQQHYDQAQSYQSVGNLTEAARQYRIFIADALGELAIERARTGDYDKAAPLFDEALGLAPIPLCSKSNTLRQRLRTAVFLTQGRWLSESFATTQPTQRPAPRLTWSWGVC